MPARVKSVKLGALNLQNRSIIYLLEEVLGGWVSSQVVPKRIRGI